MTGSSALDGDRDAAVHEAYADPVDGGWDGYQAACRTCDWRAEKVHKSKLKAQEEAAIHVAESPGRAHLLGVKVGDVHPCDDPSGWPEFEVTLSFYVSSEDPEVAAAERKRILEDTAWDEIA